MTATSAYATYDTSYTNRVPYITIEEYQSAPTAMDTSNLIAGGQASAQIIALQETIGRASSWVDQFTMGAYGTLAATQTVENARIWGNNMGQLIVHPRYWPILEVDSFTYSPQGAFGTNSAASITPAGNVWIEPQQFIVQPGSTVGFGLGGAGGIAGGYQYFCTWSYTNGYPVTTLAASVSAGATSFTPQSTVGIYPGTTLTAYDLPYDEQVIVQSTYVPGSAVVPLVYPFVYPHQSGVMITNLPPSVKQAAILATTGFIKQRGSGALIAGDIGEITRTQPGYAQNSGSDWDQARMLLNPFKQIFIGY